MNPFYFGSAERALYGVYHPPKVKGGGRRGVVLCYPFGVEYMRAHRAFRQLTNLLVRAGLHVLRFDYHGTGDSMGDGHDDRLAGWRSDVETAIRELRDTAGIETVSVVGLRLGANVAAGAVEGRTDVERLVLWDPVTSGPRYLSQGLRRPVAGPVRPGPTDVEGVIGVQGFPMSPALAEELLGLEFEVPGPVPGMRVELVTSRAAAEFSELFDRIVAAGHPAEHHVVPSEGNWAEGDAFGSALLPQGIIQAIVELLSAAPRPQGSATQR